MTEKEKKNISKFISKILRHRPEIIGIRLDEHGWADADELIAGVRRAGHPGFDREKLDEIVETNNKKRYSYSADGRLIRANQGHSIPVDVELPEMTPPRKTLRPSVASVTIRRKVPLYILNTELVLAMITPPLAPSAP
jgi:RNA:NAD 2'-phosphotransferase (TPT1/KptA family)